MARRDALLELCLPDTPKGRQRKLALRALITSDTAFSRCTFYTTDPPPSKAEWARAMAQNLLPAAVPLLQRQRWLCSAAAFAAAALAAQRAQRRAARQSVMDCAHAARGPAAPVGAVGHPRGPRKARAAFAPVEARTHGTPSERVSIGMPELAVSGVQLAGFGVGGHRSPS